MPSSICWFLVSKDPVTDKRLGEYLQTPHFMLLQKGAREDAIHALINIWLKDATKTCGWCGSNYVEGLTCCEKPFIGTNADILRRFTEELRETRRTRLNKFGSNKDKTMRIILSFPPGLLQYLESAFFNMYQEKLFNETYDTNWFAKHFGKYFAVPEEI